MRFLDKVVFKQNVYKDLMITAITSLILESTSTSDYYMINKGGSK